MLGWPLMGQREAGPRTEHRGHVDFTLVSASGQIQPLPCEHFKRDPCFPRAEAVVGQVSAEVEDPC